MIKLYPQKETEFKSNGTVLRDCFSAVITEESNSLFSAEFEFPITNKLLNEKMIIVAPTPRGEQPFRITKIKKKYDKSNKIFVVSARHLTYDLLDNLVLNVRPTNQDATNFGKTIFAGTQYPHPFIFKSEDIQGTNTANFVRRNPIDCLIGNTDNSMISLFGGDLERDWYNITLKGGNRDRGFKIEPKRNLVAIEEELELSDVKTRIYPTFVITDNKVEELPEKVIDSPYLNNYPNPIINEYRVELSEEEKKFSLTQIQEIVRNRAKALFSVEKIDLPKANWKVDFVQLEKTEQYKLIPVLTTLQLNDTVTVRVAALNIDIQAKVIRYTYDAKLKKYLKIELGNFKKSLVNQKVELQKTIEKAIKNQDGEITQKLKESLDKIMGNTGGYQKTLFNAEGLPQGTIWMDSPNESTAKNYIIINNQGIAFGNQGLSVPPELAISIDGSIVGDSAFFNSITTNLIESDFGQKLILKSKEAIVSTVTGSDTYKADIAKTANNRNYLLDSKRNLTNNLYLHSNYHIAEPLKEGELVTVVIKGALGAGKSYFSLYNSGPSVSIVPIAESSKIGDVYVKTFPWKVAGSTNDFINVYTIPNSVAVDSTIEWITLFRGEKYITEYVPSWEELNGNANLLPNSSFQNNLDYWEPNVEGAAEIVTEDGFKCVHIKGELGKQKQIRCEIVNKVIPNPIYVISGWIKKKNIIKGSTNPFLAAAYIEGWKEDGTYNGVNIPIESFNSDFEDILTHTWTRFKFAFKVDNTAYKTLKVYIIGRDFTGDIYARDFTMCESTIAKYHHSKSDVETAGDSDLRNLADKQALDALGIQENLGALEERTSNVEQEITQDAIVDKITSSSKYIGDFSKMGQQIVDVQNQFQKDLTGFGDIWNAKYTDMDGRVSEMSNYLRYDAPTNTLSLGTTANPFLMKLTNTMLGFYDSDNLLAYFEKQKLFVEEIEVLKSIKIGRHMQLAYADTLTIDLFVGD